MAAPGSQDRGSLVVVTSRQTHHVLISFNRSFAIAGIKGSYYFYTPPDIPDKLSDLLRKPQNLILKP
jgi:hypothetical protein